MSAAKDAPGALLLPPAGDGGFPMKKVRDQEGATQEEQQAGISNPPKTLPKGKVEDEGDETTEQRKSILKMNGFKEYLHRNDNKYMDIGMTDLRDT